MPTVPPERQLTQLDPEKLIRGEATVPVEHVSTPARYISHIKGCEQTHTHQFQRKHGQVMHTLHGKVEAIITCLDGLAVSYRSSVTPN